MGYFKSDELNDAGFGYLNGWGLGMTSIGTTDNFARANQAAKAAVDALVNPWSDALRDAKSRLATLKVQRDQLNDYANKGSPSAAGAFQQVNADVGAVESLVGRMEGAINGFMTQYNIIQQKDTANQIQPGSDWVWLQNSVLPGAKTQVETPLSQLASLLPNAASAANSAVSQAAYEVQQAAREAALIAQSAPPPAPTATATANAPAAPAGPDWGAMMNMMQSYLTTPPPAQSQVLPIPMPSSSPPPMAYNPASDPYTSSQQDPNAYYYGYSSQPNVNVSVQGQGYSQADVDAMIEQAIQDYLMQMAMIQFQPVSEGPNMPTDYDYRGYGTTTARARPAPEMFGMNGMGASAPSGFSMSNALNSIKADLTKRLSAVKDSFLRPTEQPGTVATPSGGWGAKEIGIAALVVLGAVKFMGKKGR